MNLAAGVAAVQDGHIRLAILQLLDGQPNGSANDMALYDAINAMPYTVSREGLRGHIFWLQAQNAVHVLDLRSKSGLVVATLTERGGDLAKGRSAVAGVERPQPAG